MEHGLSVLPNWKRWLFRITANEYIMKTAKEFAEEHQYDLEEHDEGGYLGINENAFAKLLDEYADQKVNELNKAFVSGQLPNNLILYRQAKKLDYGEFCKWINAKLVNLH